MSIGTSMFENLVGCLDTIPEPKGPIETDSNVDFLKKKYATSKNRVVHAYEDFQSFEENRDEFDQILRRFLEAVFEQTACKHPCVLPIIKWSLVSLDYDQEEIKEMIKPAFSIVNSKYDITLYDYMAQWQTNGFDPTIGSIILYGLASGFSYIISQGYSYSYLSPKNIFLSPKKKDRYNIIIMEPLIGNLGLVDDRDFKDPNTLRPAELSDTKNPHIIKFLVSLYLLFQQPTDNKESITADYFGFSKSIPKEFISIDNTNNEIIGNPKLFLLNKNLYSFENQNDDCLTSYIDALKLNEENLGLTKVQEDSELSTTYQIDLNSELTETDEIANIKTVNQAIATIQDISDNDGEMGEKTQNQLSIYFPFLAVIYASGDIGSSPNLCHAAYYAQLANIVSSKNLPTTILTKYPIRQFDSEAERLFYEGEILEGNAYAYSEESDGDVEIDLKVNEILSMAAKKYMESAKLGFDKAKTRLAFLIDEANNLSMEMKKDAFHKLLIPAAKTDPDAMFRVGMHYLNTKQLDLAISYLNRAYLNNHPDSIFQLAKAHHSAAHKKMKNTNMSIDDKNEIINHLKRAHKLYDISAKLHDNDVARRMKISIGEFLTNNNVEL